MRQYACSDAGFEEFRKNTRKRPFLEEMATIIPWQELTAAIVPFYPNPEEVGMLEPSANNAHTLRGHHTGTATGIGLLPRPGVYDEHTSRQHPDSGEYWRLSAAL